MFDVQFDMMQFGHGNSFIHRIHPALKIFAGLALVISNAFILNVYYSLVVIGFVLVVAVLGQIDFKSFLKWYLFVIYFFLAMAITYSLFFGFHLQFVIGLFIRFTSFSFPMMLLIFISPILETLYGLEWLLSPLAKIRIPVNGFILVVTISISFIPIVVTEIQRILYTMAVRGSDIRYAKWGEKVKIIIRTLIPLLIATLNRCEILASAITVKNYDAFKPRTNILTQKWKLSDSFYAIITIAIFTITYIAIPK